jgi:formyltetrahydrofolate synthetase
MHLVFYVTAHLDKTGAPLNLYYDELTQVPMTMDEIAQTLASGEEVHIRPAARHDMAAIANLEAQLAIVMAQRTAAEGEMFSWINSMYGRALVLEQIMQSNGENNADQS